MNTSMRDLNLIREQHDDADGIGRRVGLFGAAGAVTILLVLGLCAQLEGPSTASAVSVESEDPLARLDLPTATVGEEPPAPSVDRVALAFPERLDEEPPEVAAAMAAAAAEAAHPDLLPALAEVAPAGVLPAALTATLPSLPSILPTEPSRSFPSATAEVGHDGEYTIQVISYDSPEGAQAFAAGLQARGHRAFVMRAEVPGRGTMFRVRIGPFENMRDASQYRSRFETEERMNTIVVRRRVDEG